METMERDAKFIAERCRLIRKMLGWTQENLADAANLTTRTIEKTESGKHTPSEQTLNLIAKAIDYDVKVFSKPSAEEEKQVEEELLRSIRKTALVPTSPIESAGDFLTRYRDWDAHLADTSAIEGNDALRLAAAVIDWIAELNGLWETCGKSQQLEFSESISEICQKLKDLGYLVHLGCFRQQHIDDKGLLFDVVAIAFLPKETHDGERFMIINLDDPWEIPEVDRPKS